MTMERKVTFARRAARSAVHLACVIAAGAILAAHFLLLKTEPSAFAWGASCALGGYGLYSLQKGDVSAFAEWAVDKVKSVKGSGQ